MMLVLHDVGLILYRYYMILDLYNVRTYLMLVLYYVGLM